MKEELKSFSIDIDDIEPSYEPFKEIQKAIATMKQEYLIENVEVILNENLLTCYNKPNNYRTIFGARVSLESLDKDVSFIVREDTKPTYEKLEQQLQSYKQKEDKLREYVLSVIKEHETGQYDVSTVGLAIKEHKGVENLLEILNEGE